MPVEQLQREICAASAARWGSTEPPEIAPRAAPQPGARRLRQQRGDGAGASRSRRAAAPDRRGARRAPRPGAARGSAPPRSPGPGFINFRLAGDLRPGRARAHRRRGRRVTGAPRRAAGEPVHGRVRLRQPDRTAAHRARPAGGARRRDRGAARVDRVEGRTASSTTTTRASRSSGSPAASGRATSSASARDVEFPEDGYHGELRHRARRASSTPRTGDRYAGDDSARGARCDARASPSRELRAEQNRDLDDFRVHFDNFYLESSLYGDGRGRGDDPPAARDRARLRAGGRALAAHHRVRRRQGPGDGQERRHPHLLPARRRVPPDKWERGFQRAINVQGADHHGTVARVRAGLRALGLPDGYPEYVLHQMVLVMRGGEEVKF